MQQEPVVPKLTGSNNRVTQEPTEQTMATTKTQKLENAGVLHGLGPDQGLDPRVVVLTDKEEVREAAELVGSSFAGSETSCPEGFMDWAFGPEMRNGEPLYGPLAKPPCEKRVACARWVAYFIAFSTWRHGFLLGIRDESDSLVGVAIVKTPSMLWGPISNLFEMVRGCASTPTLNPEWMTGDHKEKTTIRMNLIDQVFNFAKKTVVGKKSVYKLSMLAVAPSAQGKGVGSALLRALGAIADRDNEYCYLETSGSRNKSLYERFGYQSQLTIETCNVDLHHAVALGIERYNHPGGLNFMLRPPQTSQAVVDD